VLLDRDFDGDGRTDIFWYAPGSVFVILDTKYQHHDIFKAFAAQTGGDHERMDRVLPRGAARRPTRSSRRGSCRSEPGTRHAPAAGSRLGARVLSP
jgi:hypothetical protein